MPLDHTRQQLDTRFRRLGMMLSDELGLRRSIVQFDTINSRSGLIIWDLKRGEHTADAESGRGRDTVVRLTSRDKTALWFGLSEHWRISGKQKLRFSESRLRFYVSQGRDAQPDQNTLLRLEWSDRGLDDSGRLLFPGRGAAHPHWQFDDPAESNAASIALELVETPQTEEDTTVDLTEELLSDEPLRATQEAMTRDGSAANLQAARYSWFHKVHFAARAHWADEICDLQEESQPHAHAPDSLEQIDKWIISALRYMGHEFDKYAP